MIMAYTHTTLELVACLMLTVRFSMDLAGVFQYPGNPGPAGMALCVLIEGASLVTLGLNGATASVVVHTLDRYWKIVHATQHRMYYRRWMLYLGVFLPWLNGLAVHLLPAIGTTRIVNGVCLSTVFWPSLRMSQVRNLHIAELTTRHILRVTRDLRVMIIAHHLHTCSLTAFID